MILVRELTQALRQKGWRLATAESCTGGMIATAITDPAGASDVFDRSYVTYSNAAKQEMLGVSAASLDAYGAVSEPVAREMALGARMHAGVEIALSVTGIAGPGGSEFKPEGRVCFGLSTEAVTLTKTIEFGALGRAQVRQESVVAALAMALAEIKRT